VFVTEKQYLLLMSHKGADLAGVWFGCSSLCNK